MKKISLYLLIFTMLYCLCACGKNSDAKSNSREDDGRKEQKIIISSIQVASNTKVMRAKVFLPNVKYLEGTNYWLGGLDTTSKVDVIDTGDGIQINVCGFYSDDTAWKNPKVYKGFQSPDNSNTPLKNVLVKGKVVPMKEKMLKADVKKTKKTIPVEITPYTVSICPVNDWREKGCFYHCNLLEYLTQRDIQTKNSGVNVRYRGKHRFFKGFNEFIKEKTRRCDNDFEKIERHVFF